MFPWDISEPAQRDNPGQGREGTSEREAVLVVKVEMLEHQLERERDTIADLRKRLDRAEDRVLALTSQTLPPALELTPTRRRWWPF